MIVIADYGVGNLASVSNMLRKVGAEVLISRKPEDILSADKLLLPGVGHFDHGMKSLNSSGIRDALDRFALDLKRPVLGICLGAQIMGQSSEEGSLSGLGWFDMTCLRFRESIGLRIPHMGWNQISQKKPSLLLDRQEADARYYFVHSYQMTLSNATDILATTIYGSEFVCAIQRENLTGVQFHPEKSLRHGIALMRAFAEQT